MCNCAVNTYFCFQNSILIIIYLNIDCVCGHLSILSLVFFYNTMGLLRCCMLASAAIVVLLLSPESVSSSWATTHSLTTFCALFFFSSSSFATSSLYSEMARWRMCKAYHLSLTRYTHTQTLTLRQTRTHWQTFPNTRSLVHTLFLWYGSTMKRETKRKKKCIRTYVYRARSLRAALHQKEVEIFYGQM